MPREVLGEEFGGTVTCDFPGRCSPSPCARARAGYGGYNKLGVLQRCWAHLLQDAKELAELNADRPEVVAWESASGGLKALYQAAKAFSHPNRRARRRERRRFERLAGELARPFADDASAPQRTLSQRLLKHRHELFVFVSHPEVPPTNNPASQGEVAWRMLLCEVPTPPK